MNHAGRVGQWEALITPAQHADIVAFLGDAGRRNAHPGGRRVHWLAGIIVCGKCGSPLRVISPNGYVNYACRKCYGVSVAKHHAEEAVSEMLFAVAPPTPTRDAAAATDREVSAAAAADARLADLAAMYAAGDITRSEWVAAREATPRSRTSAAASTSASTSIPAQLHLAWGQLTVDHQNAIARKYLHRVEVLPTGSGPFDAERLAPSWIE